MNLLTTSQQQPTTTTVSLHSPPANANLTNSMNNSDFQQQQQQLQQHQQVNIQQQNQQPIYYMYQDATSLDVDQTLEYEGHVSHTAQAAPITGNYISFLASRLLLPKFSLDLILANNKIFNYCNFLFKSNG